MNELGASIEAVSDSNWRNIDWTDQKVIAPEEVMKRNFDIIYIAILNEKVCQNIKVI